MFGVELPSPQKEAFFENVWLLVRQIPAGRVATYGQIAGYIPVPDPISPEDYQTNRARWVGNAMAASPKGVPWQRVINAQGKISTRQGAQTQHELLLSEGVIFDSRDRIDLSRFGWSGPDPDWLRSHGFKTPDEPTQLRLL